MKTVPPSQGASDQKEKKHMKNMLKVLKPKVYITDTLRFKSLVQEITGNGRLSASSRPQISVIDIEDSSEDYSKGEGGGDQKIEFPCNYTDFSAMVSQGISQPENEQAPLYDGCLLQPWDESFLSQYDFSELYNILYS